MWHPFSHARSRVNFSLRYFFWRMESAIDRNWSNQAAWVKWPDVLVRVSPARKRKHAAGNNSARRSASHTISGSVSIPADIASSTSIACRVTDSGFSVVRSSTFTPAEPSPNFFPKRERFWSQFWWFSGRIRSRFTLLLGPRVLLCPRCSNLSYHLFQGGKRESFA